jgi:hypothetical protein
MAHALLSHEAQWLAGTLVADLYPAIATWDASI